VADLFLERWKDLDSHELRIILDRHVGGPGQYHGRTEQPNRFYLPLAGDACRLVLTFREKAIANIEPGPAFDADQWRTISEDLDGSLKPGPLVFGREYSFSSFRVPGSWSGTRSRVQILPPPDEAPRANQEVADHPFILEFPIKGSDFWPLINYRRMREHRNITLVLNVLLAGHTSALPRQLRHFWASAVNPAGEFESRWVQEAFFANLGDVVRNEPTPITGPTLPEVEAARYLEDVGHDGRGLRVPTDLDESIQAYSNLLDSNRIKFDRAAFWLEMASRQWTVSFSISFAALVSAVESLTTRGAIHRLQCEQCAAERPHEQPGATEAFRALFEEYAPGAALRKRRSEMYALRSGILHGSDLMEFDRNRDFGWDPPWSNQRELHSELWSITGLAIRNWLKNPPAVP